MLTEIRTTLDLILNIALNIVVHFGWIILVVLAIALLCKLNNEGKL